jgi:hypothetical protein
MLALDLEAARAAQPEILAAFGISRDRSPDLEPARLDRPGSRECDLDESTRVVPLASMPKRAGELRGPSASGQ